MPLLGPSGVTVTIGASATSGTFTGDMSALNVQIGMELFIGSRNGRKGEGRILTDFALVGTTGATFSIAEAFPSAATTLPFVIDNFAAPISIAAQNNLSLTILLNALRKFFGLSLTLDQNSKTLPRSRAAGAGTFFQDIWDIAGRVWGGLEHRTVSGVERLMIRAYPDGTNPVAALDIDLTSGGVKSKSVEGSVASATTCDISAPRTGRVVITGTATINSLGTTPNEFIFLRFAGALTLTHNATSLILEGGVNIGTAAGDTVLATSDASGNWRLIGYRRAAVAPLGVSDADKLGWIASGGRLIDAGDFEAGLAGWTFSAGGAAGATATVVAGSAPSGNKHVALDLGSIGPATGSPSITENALMPVEAGSLLLVSLNLRANLAITDMAIIARLTWRKSDGTTVAATVGTAEMKTGSGTAVVSVSGYSDIRVINVTTGWARRVALFRVPSDAAWLQRSLTVIGSATTARVHEFDNFSITKVLETAEGTPAASITNALLSTVATATLKGRATAGTGAVEDLTAAQARTVLGLATSDAPTLAGLTLGSAGFVLAAKTFATLPTPSGATGQTYRVTDRNHRMATSDGTNWRWGDNTIAA